MISFSSPDCHCPSDIYFWIGTVTQLCRSVAQSVNAPFLGVLFVFGPRPNSVAREETHQPLRLAQCESHCVRDRRHSACDLKDDPVEICENDLGLHLLHLDHVKFEVFVHALIDSYRSAGLLPTYWLWKSPLAYFGDLRVGRTSLQMDASNEHLSDLPALSV